MNQAARQLGGASGWGSHFDDLADQLWSMMQDMQSTSMFKLPVSPEWRPRLNLYETAQSFVVCVELAGVNASEISVCCERSVLNIRGVRAKPVVPDDPPRVGVHLMEIDSGRFQRDVPVPADVDVAGITADFANGYLWINLPRVAPLESEG